MESPLTLLLHCVSQPLDRFQYLDRKYSLGARQAQCFAISLFTYVLWVDCLIVYVSTINTFTAHSFVGSDSNNLTGTIPSAIGDMVALAVCRLGESFKTTTRKTNLAKRHKNTVLTFWNTFETVQATTIIVMIRTKGSVGRRMHTR